MVYSKPDSAVLGFLGRALSLELTAIQQYLTLSRLLKLRGFDELGERLQREADDELGHAGRIINRMLVLGVAPNATQLRPVSLGNSLPELMAALQSLEADLVRFYEQAVQHCAAVNDFDNRLFFEQLLDEERGHLNALADWQQQHLRAPTGKK